MPSPQTRVFISSADWMPRNLDRRVETLVPVENPHRAPAGAEPDHGRQPQRRGPELEAWTPRAATPATRPGTSKAAFSAHEYFMTNPSLSGRGHKVKDLPQAFDHVGPRKRS